MVTGQNREESHPNRGQSVTEYVIIVIVVAVLVIAAIRYFGGSIIGQFQNASEEIATVRKEPSDATVRTESETPRKSGRSERLADDLDSGGESRGTALGALEELRPPGVGDEESAPAAVLDWPTMIGVGTVVCVLGLAIVFVTRERKKRPKKRFRLFARKGEEGQVLVIGLFVVLGLSMLAITVANVGMIVAEKIHLQDTVDAAAYSSAVVEARYMNLSAYINRAMVANYNQMAFDTAVWAVIDADDHAAAVVTAILYQISTILTAFVFTIPYAIDVDEVADGFAEVHSVLHDLNYRMNDMFAQDERDLNQYIEDFNIYILTMYQGLLYAATQSMRHEVAQEVAHKMDPNVLTRSVLGMGAEAVSFDELARAVDFVIRDVDARGEPFRSLNSGFNRMMGEQEDTSTHIALLGAVTEASLDRFAAGRDREGVKDFLRNFDLGNILGELLAGAEVLLTAKCYKDCAEDCVWSLFTDCSCSCDSEINLTLGSDMREGLEDKHDEAHVPFIARQRMREVNMFGIGFDVQDVGSSNQVQSLLGTHGHTSGEWHADVGNFRNGEISLGGFDLERMWECQQAGCYLNMINVLEAEAMLPASLIVRPFFVDDHWDGAWDGIKPDCTWQVYPPFTCYPRTVEYQLAAAEDGLEEGVPKYDWQVDLDNVGIPHYIYPEEGAAERPDGTSGGGENNLLSGPSIAVVGVKKASKVQGLIGLGINSDYDLTAIARGQVYYLRNPNRPQEKPSLFNPHWTARLAPLESEDTPSLLRQGLPFVSSMGIPITPTH